MSEDAISDRESERERVRELLAHAVAGHVTERDCVTLAHLSMRCEALEAENAELRTRRCETCAHRVQPVPDGYWDCGIAADWCAPNGFSEWRGKEEDREESI